MSEKEISHLKELFEEKFRGVHAQLDAEFGVVNSRLEKIEAQTTKTNGRVFELEKKEISHIINCPQTEKISKINEDLVEYRMIKKYPKIGITLIAVAAILLAVSLYNLKLNMKFENNTKPLIEATK